MFLLAKLHLTSLEDKINLYQLETALDSLPSGSDAYDQAYEETMKRIQSQRKGLCDLAFKAMAWIVHAYRPLKKLELQHALATTKGDVALNFKNITDIEQLVSVCAGLVTVDKQSDVISLVHHTTREYFHRKGAKWFPTAQDEIALTCAAYLSFQEFETKPRTYDGKRAQIRTYALYEYAANYWGDHARNSSIQGDDLLLDFLKSASKVSGSAQIIKHRAISRPNYGIELAAHNWNIAGPRC